MYQKSLTAFGAAVALALLVSGCSGSAAADAPEVTTIRYQGAPNSVSLIEVAAELGYLDDLDLDWVSNTTSGPQSIQSVAAFLALAHCRRCRIMIVRRLNRWPGRVPGRLPVDSVGAALGWPFLLPKTINVAVSHPRSPAIGARSNFQS